MEKVTSIDQFWKSLKPTQPEYWFQYDNPFGNFYVDPTTQESPQPDKLTPPTITYGSFALTSPKSDTKPQGKKLSGYRQQDLDAFNKMYDELGELDFREFLTKIAGLESRWQNNPAGNNTHSGLYQIKNTYLEHYTGVKGITKDQFVRDPKLQTKAALALAKENYNQITKDEALLNAASKKGYGVWELMAGAWLAGYKGMRRQFFTGKEVGDANGTTITKRMNAYKNMVV